MYLKMRLGTYQKLCSIITVCSLQVFSIYRAIILYIHLKEEALSQKHGVLWDSHVVQVYFWTICSAMFILIMVASISIVKTGHYANDEKVLWSKAKSTISLKEQLVTDVPEDQKLGNNTEANVLLDQASGLFFVMFYFFNAYIILIPLPWISGEQINHEAKPAAELWRTELDFIFPPKPLTPKLSNLDILNPDQNALATALIALQPPALGGLGQLPQTEQQLEFAKTLRWNSAIGLFQSTHPGTVAGTPLASRDRSPSMELLSFIFAGWLLCYQLPAVFWKVSRRTTCLFSCLILLTVAHLIVDYAATCLLIKYSICLTESTDMTRTGDVQTSLLYKELRASLMLVKSSVRYPAWVLTCLTAVAFIPTILNIHIFYVYGCATWMEDNLSVSEEQACQHSYHPEDIEKRYFYDCHPSEGETPSVKLVGSRYTAKRWSTVCLFSGLSCVVALTGLRMPIQVELMSLYLSDGGALFLTCTTVFITHTVAWLVCWIGALCHLRRSICCHQPKAQPHKVAASGRCLNFGAHKQSYKNDQIQTNAHQTEQTFSAHSTRQGHSVVTHEQVSLSNSRNGSTNLSGGLYWTIYKSPTLERNNSKPETQQDTLSNIDRNTTLPLGKKSLHNGKSSNTAETPKLFNKHNGEEQLRVKSTMNFLDSLGSGQMLTLVNSPSFKNRTIDTIPGQSMPSSSSFACGIPELEIGCLSKTGQQPQHSHPPSFQQDGSDHTSTCNQNASDSGESLYKTNEPYRFLVSHPDTQVSSHQPNIESDWLHAYRSTPENDLHLTATQCTTLANTQAYNGSDRAGPAANLYWTGLQTTVGPRSVISDSTSEPVSSTLIFDSTLCSQV